MKRKYNKKKESFFHKEKGFFFRKIICGDCLKVMRQLDDNSIDAVITDIPYGIGFMGKEWDKFTSTYQEWCRQWSAEALRIAKPGAFLLCFGGTRTFHRLTCGLEDAGWQIRDCLMWLYGSGFPKSHNISKAIDKTKRMYKKGALLPSSRTTEASQTGIATTFREKTATNPQTDLAKLWNGYGTALKPAWEPIIVAMKPLDGTFAHNAEKWGVAGLNIDAGRIVTTEKIHTPERTNLQGRWPANVIHNGLRREEWTRYFYCAKASRAERNIGLEGLQKKRTGSMVGNTDNGNFLTGSGNPRRGIGQNNHPTVKPLKLMEYLCKLVKPPKGGLLLDPFCGSGTTLMAAVKTGWDYIGIEKEPEYCEIARYRVEKTAKVAAVRRKLALRKKKPAEPSIAERAERRSRK